MEIKLSSYNEIKDFINEEWDNFFKSKNIERKTKPKHYFFKAEENNKVVGVAVLSTKGGIGTLEDILIEENYRGKNIGKALLGYVEKKAKQENCRKILLKTSDLHQEAKQFYQSQGYQIIATIPGLWYSSDWYFFVKEII